MNKILEIIKNKWLRNTSFTILLIAIVIAIYIAINLGVKMFDIADIDLTSEGFYSLSEESKNQIKNINQEINIYTFGYDEDSNVVDLAKQYSRYKENINVYVTAVNDRPDIAKEYSITSEDEENQTVIFVCEGRSIKANSYDFYTRDYTTYEYIDLTEQKMTNSILAVTLENAPKVYFLTGHSEYGLKDYFQILAETLQGEVNEVESLDILVKNEIPQDCKTLIIAAPETDFTDFETEQIIKYIENGGNILWLSDYSNVGTLKNIQKILDLYGVTINNNGVVLEQDASSMLMQTQDLILPTINSGAEITNPFATSGKVLFIDSGKLEFQDEEKMEELGVTVTELLTTSDKAFFRTDFNINSSNPKENEEINKFVVGALLEKTVTEESEDNTSKLVIYTNGLFATDYPITINNKAANAIYFYNNEDLILNSISYLTEREDTITIRKTYGSVTYTPTEIEDITVKIIIFTVPLIIIAVGIGIWIMRKRRK